MNKSNSIKMKIFGGFITAQQSHKIEPGADGSSVFLQVETSYQSLVGLCPLVGLYPNEEAARLDFKTAALKAFPEKDRWTNHHWDLVEYPGVTVNKTV